MVPDCSDEVIMSADVPFGLVRSDDKKLFDSDSFSCRKKTSKVG